MEGLRVIVTGGGTREPIDDVRHVANVASGALPAAMAEALLSRGAEVHHLHGPGAVLPGEIRLQLDTLRLSPSGLRSACARLLDEALARHERLQGGVLHLHPIETAEQAADRLEQLCREVQPHLVLCAMAVADFAPAPIAGKLLSRKDSLGTASTGQVVGDEGLVLRMYPTVKAIDRVKAAAPHCRLVGFKLLAGADEPTLVAAASHLARRAKADLVFANDIHDYRAGLRRGLLVDGDGDVLARLDGGEGEAGLQGLARRITAACLQGLDVT